MKNRSLSLCSAVFFLFLFSCEAPRRMTGRDFADYEREIFVLNSLAESLSVIPADSPGDSSIRIHHNVALTGAWPNALLYYNERLFIVNSGDNSIDVYDESTLAFPPGKIRLGQGRNPYGIVRLTETSIAYVTNWVTGTVSIVDLETFEVSNSEIEVGTGPQGLAYANGKVYVCNTGYYGGAFGMGSVLVIDSETGTVIDTIETGEGSNPQTAVAIPDRNELHVALSGVNGANDGAILILDTETEQEIARITIGGSPIVKPQGIDTAHSVVYTGGTGGIMAYDYTTREILYGPFPEENPSEADFLYGNGNTQKSYPGISLVDEFLFIADFNSNRIAVVNTLTKEVTTHEGSDGPQEILFVEE